MNNKNSIGILKGLSNKNQRKEEKVIEEIKKKQTYNLTMEVIEIINVLAYKQSKKKYEIVEEAIKNLASDDMNK